MAGFFWAPGQDTTVCAGISFNPEQVKAPGGISEMEAGLSVLRGMRRALLERAADRPASIQTSKGHKKASPRERNRLEELR